MRANAAQTGRAHCDGTPVHYARHRPEQTMLYRLVQQHAQSFFARTEETIGASGRTRPDGNENMSFENPISREIRPEVSGGRCWQ